MSRNVIQLNSVTNSLGRGRQRLSDQWGVSLRAATPGQNWEQATQIIRSIPEPLRPDAITLAASLAACSHWAAMGRRLKEQVESGQAEFQGEAVQWEAAMQLFVLDFSSGLARDLGRT